MMKALLKDCLGPRPSPADMTQLPAAVQSRLASALREGLPVPLLSAIVAGVQNRAWDSTMADGRPFLYGDSTFLDDVEDALDEQDFAKLGELHKELRARLAQAVE
jgi:hypothetical protein